MELDKLHSIRSASLKRDDERRLARQIQCLLNDEPCASVEARRRISSCALLNACLHDHLPGVNALLELGADPSVILCPMANVNALHIASSHGFYQVVRRLLEADAKVDVCSGQTEIELPELRDTFFRDGHLDINKGFASPSTKATAEPVIVTGRYASSQCTLTL